MGEVQVTDCFGYVTRLFRIQLARLSLADCAKAAMARANIAAQHERGGAVGPTFKNIRAARFLANCVQVESFDQLQDIVLVRRITQPDAKPFGLGLADFLVITDYTEFAGQLITSEKILHADGKRREPGP
jgi:hypothetical protein